MITTPTVMGLTDFHAKYFSYELTKQSAADSVEKLAGALADAQVDLNPHQVEAALFAFQADGIHQLTTHRITRIPTLAPAYAM